jgi:hypothetical protein
MIAITVGWAGNPTTAGWPGHRTTTGPAGYPTIALEVSA